MKKSLVVLLSLGFVMLFSVSAFAISADFRGEYYVNGRYWDSPALLENNAATPAARRYPASYAELDQRFRLFTRFEVVKGLMLTTRADIMETQWGQDTKAAPWIATGRGWTSAANASINVEQTYLTFSAPIIGTISAGYKSARPFGWGTPFMDSTGTNPGIEWSMNIGPARVFFDFYKALKGNLQDGVAGGAGSSSIRPDFGATGGTDTDTDLYDLGVMYRTKTMDTGFMVSYLRDASTKTAAGGVMTQAYLLQPYFISSFGPVDLKAEAYWHTGKVKGEIAAIPDVDIDSKGLMVNAKFNIGPAYVGGIFLYNSGDDPGTASKVEGSTNGALGGFNRDKGNGYMGDFLTMIHGYHWHDYTSGSWGVGDPTSFDYGSIIDNMWLYQIYGGVAITKKLNLDARFSIAKADQDGAAAGWQSKDYGKELDFWVSYKIFDQLTYTVAASYLWTGDWYKGTNPTSPVKNAYYLQHQLDLNF